MDTEDRNLKDTNPKTVYGQAKPQMANLPGSALVEVSGALEHGQAKYGTMNWREDPVSAMTYAHAMVRHLQAWIDGQDNDDGSGCNHLGHVAANSMIIMDAGFCGTLIDDRPPKGVSAEVIKSRTKDIQPQKGDTDGTSQED